MSSSQRLVLVLGGAGTVGSGIVKCLLQKGFRVAVISRDTSRLDMMKSFVPVSCKENLYTLLGDVGSEEGAQKAAATLLSQVGKVTDVVSSLGFSWWQGGPPHMQSLQELQKIKINMGVAKPERLGPGYVSHLEVGEAIATVVEKKRVSHTVLCVKSTTDLKTLILEGKL